MMTPQTLFPDNFVDLITDEEIQVESVQADLEADLKKLGGKSIIEGGEIWTIPYEGEDQLAMLLDKLNRLQVRFVDEPAGWPPAAIFRDLRKRRLVSGTFKAISWTGPGKWFVVDG